MKRSRKLLVVIPIGALVAAGCGGEMTTRERGAVGGTVLGAATGAIIGAAVGNPGAGAAIGAGAGLVGGAVVGGAMQDSERRAEAAARQPPPPPPPAYGAPPPPPPPGYAPAPQARVAPSGDPTRGQLENATRWRVQVYVDQDPAGLVSAPFFTLNPGDVVPQNLDVGAHRIIAQAFVETQFGTRPVGRFDRTIQVDPRGAGWSLRFSEGDFR